MSSCSNDLRAKGLPCPRTCAVCGLGPCSQAAALPPGMSLGTSIQTHGKFEIYLTPEEFKKIQEAQYRNGENLDDTLLRMAGIRPEAHRKGWCHVAPFLYQRPTEKT
jgi:hypothetical protein